MRAVAILLAFITAFAMFVSCSDNSAGDLKDNATTTAAVTDAEPSEEDLRNAIPDGLPDTDCEGREFRIYSSTGREIKYYADEQDGEVINDSIFLAIQTVEERFNVDIMNVDSGGDDVGHNTNIRNAIMSGDDAFEVAENHDSLSGTAALEGLFLNLYDVPYLNFEQPWWPSNAVESLTYMNQMYLASSNISYCGFHQTRILFFNKDKINDYNMTEPYSYVFDGTWTLDTFIAMTQDVYEDLNGDTQRDDGDFYGYMSRGPIYCYLEQFMLTPVIKNEDDELEIAVNNERTIAFVEKMYSLLHTSKGGTIKDNAIVYDNFGAGNALFAFGELGNAIDQYRFDDVNYGMVMLPKYDESQENYRAEYTDRFFLVPKTTQDPAYVGLIFEAMSAEGYKKVIPAYYEVALKQKFTYDDESVKVLEIINDVRVLDFSYVYCADINGIFNDLFFTTPSKDFASTYAKKEKAITAKLKQITKAYEKLSEQIGA